LSLAPGSVLGILGGGQLGRMLAIAAHRLGLRVHVFAQAASEPAVQATDRHTLAPFDDESALDAFAAAVDVVTLEFENVPVAAVERLAARVPVRPGAGVLAVTQDRLAEKRFARELGLQTAPFVAFAGEVPTEFAFPARLKTRRLGYDGKGQARVDDAAAANDVWRGMGEPGAILESEVAFTRELSVLVARTPAGEISAFPPVENRHEEGILRETLAPAVITATQQRAAEGIATRLATALGLEGLLAVELFEAPDGALLINELAPRPHNSGHWTLEACLPDQFEQAVRAACAWPLGTPRVLARARMRNILGNEVAAWQEWLARPNLRLHLYGKDEPRPGRKMGHVTELEPGP
jgi:5-(carboxyamino)imidazole ribonucleotide synthase